MVHTYRDKKVVGVFAFFRAPFEEIPFNVEHMHRKKTMKSFWVNTKGQPIVDSDGRLWSTAMVEDITQRRNKREILKNEKKNINMYYQYRFGLRD
jgi:hypothetical protein